MNDEEFIGDTPNEEELDSFDQLLMDADCRVSTMVAELAEKHRFKANVVIRAVQGAVSRFDAFLHASDVCGGCGLPLEKDEEDDDADI